MLYPLLQISCPELPILTPLPNATSSVMLSVTSSVRGECFLPQNLHHSFFILLSPSTVISTYHSNFQA